MYNFFHQQRGFSLVEVILAVALFGIFATGLLGLLMNSYGSDFQASEKDKANLYAQEGLDAVWSIRRQAWNLLINGDYGLDNSSGAWQFSESVDLLEDKYTRITTIADACRSGGDLVDCPGDTVDLNTKKVNVAITYSAITGVKNSVELVAYLTTWQSKDWVQTDWLGGPGQSQWADITMYDTDDNKVDYSAMGEIKLAEVSGGGIWSPAGGENVRDDTDADFNVGIFSNTIIAGFGSSAKIELDDNIAWVEHADSRGPTNRNLRAIDIITPTDIWAVGDSGTILHYDGANWTEFVDMGNRRIYGLDMLSSSDGWAAGDRGEIYHYDGVSWTQFDDMSQNIYGIDMVSANDGWAVARKGEIYHYDGVSWSEFADMGNQTIYGIDMVSASDGWAVGGSGKIYHYDGVSWSEFIDLGGTRLNAVFMVSANDGWIVGRDGEIYRYNGSSWSAVTSPTTRDLSGIYLISAIDGLAVGRSGTIIHFDGDNWTSVTSPSTRDLFALAMVSSSESWAIGQGGRIYNYGNFYQASGSFESRIFDSGDMSTVWNSVYWTEVLPTGSSIIISTRTGDTQVPDAGWSYWSSGLNDSSLSDITSPDGQYIQYRATFTRGSDARQTPKFDNITIIYNMITDEDLRDIKIVSDTNVWFVGDRGKIFNYNGSYWNESADMGNADILAIDMASVTAGWAAGSSAKVYQYLTPNWNEFEDFGGGFWRDVDMLGAADGWMIRNEGLIYYYDGENWTEFTDTGDMNWYSIFMLDDEDGWVVGNEGAIYHYDGANWIQFVDTGDETWESIYMVSPDDGWVVGRGGNIRHYDGFTWSAVTSPVTRDLYSVYMVTATNGWAVGRNGNIIHFDGEEWTSVTTPTSNHLYSVAMVSDADGWAVGRNGTVLRFSGVASGFEVAGSFISSAFNTGTQGSFNFVSWDEIIPTCSPVCEIKLQIRTALDSGGSPDVWSNWYGALGSGTYFTDSSGALVSIDLNFNQWVQYRAELTSDGINTPILQEVRINYTP